MAASVSVGHDGAARYDFFISYAHADIIRVRQFDRVLRDLLRRPFRRHGFQVFRDETGLTAGQDLTERLREKLRDSKWLLVFLTTSTARPNTWVDKEVSFWCEELGRADRLIIVRADAAVDLAWDDNTDSFLDVAGLPPAIVQAVHAVPFYADLTAGTPASDQDAAVRIVGTVLGRPPEDVAGEEYRIQRRRRRLVRGAVSGLSLLTASSLVAGVLAVQASNRAQRNERRAVADALASQALVEANDRPDKSLALAVASHRLDAKGSGNDVLLGLLQRLDGRDRFLRTAAKFSAAAVSESGHVVALGDDEGGIRLVGVDDPVLATPAKTFGRPVIGLAFADETHLLAALRDDRIVELTTTSLRDVRQTAELAFPILRSWAYDAASGTIAVGGSDDDLKRGSVSLVRSRPGSLVALRSTSTFRPDLIATVRSLAFNGDGSLIAVGHVRGVEILESASLVPATITLDACVRDRTSVLAAIDDAVAAFTADGDIVVGGNPVGSNSDNGQLGSCGLSTKSTADQRYGFERSISHLVRCGSTVVFGSDAGEYGKVSFPLVAPQSLANVDGAIGGLACNSGGLLIVATTTGFVHIQHLDAPTALVRSPAPIFETVSEADLRELKSSQLVNAGLAMDGIQTGDDRVLPFPAGGDQLSRLLLGQGHSSFNCVSISELNIGSTNKVRSAGQSLGRCGRLEIRAADPLATSIEIWRDGTRLSTVGEQWATRTIAWSRDGRKLFLGGNLEGTLYDVTNPADPRQVVRMAAQSVFGAASFTAQGNVLITGVVFPPAYSISAQVNIIGGDPLDRLGCSVGRGTLAHTIATQLIRERARAKLKCGEN